MLEVSEATNRLVTLFMILKVGLASRLMAGLSGMWIHWFPMKNSWFVLTIVY